jgi:hypothetical protein
LVQNHRSFSQEIKHRQKKTALLKILKKNMASFFRRLTQTVTSSVGEALKTVNDVAAAISLDNLQEKYGDADGKKALYDGLDLTYVAPRLIGV